MFTSPAGSVALLDGPLVRACPGVAFRRDGISCRGVRMRDRSSLDTWTVLPSNVFFLRHLFWNVVFHLAAGNQLISV